MSDPDGISDEIKKAIERNPIAVLNQVIPLRLYLKLAQQIIPSYQAQSRTNDALLSIALHKIIGLQESEFLKLSLVERLPFLEAAAMKRRRQPTGNPMKKATRTTPKARIKLGQALQFDWLTYRDLGNPDDENEDYNDWRIYEGKSGDFELSLDESKKLRRWFTGTHLKRHRTDEVSLDAGSELSDGDKQAVTEWLKDWRKKGKK